jgi:6,7-dimethyl-8-ribityllumazine synthase
MIMPIKRIASNLRGQGRRVAVVLSRFNPAVGDGLLSGALRGLREAGVAEGDITVVTVPGALEIPLAAQRFAQSGDIDAIVALGAVIRGETYHFEVVSNESAAGLSGVQLEFGVPVANGVLTTESDAQALARAEVKGYEAARTAIELANLLDAIDEA